VLTEDLDRSLLTIRTAPKPLLSVDGQGRLSPQNPPLPKDPEDWLRASPLSLRSYLVSLLLTKARRRDFNPHMDEVMSLNRSIIGAVQEITTKEGLDLLYVIFYAPSKIESPDWRERFLKEELEKRSIRHLDTRVAIDAWCKRTGKPVAALYEASGHHNNLGNEVIGNALIEAMTRK
jgi:hypothetical protein